MKSRIQRPLVDAQNILGDLKNPLRDPPAMLRAEGQDFEYQQVERALQQVASGRWGHVVPLVDVRQEYLVLLSTVYKESQCLKTDTAWESGRFGAREQELSFQAPRLLGS